MADEDNIPEEQQVDDWEQALAEQAATEIPAVEDGSNGLPQAQLEDLKDDQTSMDEIGNLNAILDIPVSLSVEIGQSRISIRNLLQLNQGSVVELDRLAGEPLDVMINNTLIAHGEVVVINEKYGIRLTDVISAHERVKQLQ